ncbi:hypothetical protein ACHHYP_13345 [Achlya hypogyna]|uniref:Transmembrane protein n=1 Tax=Achlya hypogyna TaxID=1202772 RepID=A0A1V9YFI4_ACHHY|nr:hypothetical protein ACHHYP_13345 [Achlya hypogyna]
MGTSTERYAVRVLPKRGIGRRMYKALVSAIGLGVVGLVTGDAVLNTWAVNDFLGAGCFFLTPIASASTLGDLMAQYRFARRVGIGDLSKVAMWMANYTITNMVSKSGRVYLVDAGLFPLTPATVLCPIFEQTYDVGDSLHVHLAVAVDSVSYFRGNALSHVFARDSTLPAVAGMTSNELTLLGYVPGRTTVDQRFTGLLRVANTSAPQIHIVRYFRIFTRSFCTGCDPVAELGFSECNLTLSFDAGASTLTVASSTFVPGSSYSLGFVMPSGSYSTAALTCKLLAVVFGVAGFVASRRSAQWHDADATRAESLGTRLLRKVAPKVYPYASDAMRYDMFCYNSDWFVSLYALSVVLDVPNSFVFVHTANLYNEHAPQLGHSLQLFMLSTRLLWVNCALLKAVKVAWSALGRATYCGESRLMGYCNLSSVLSLYASAVLLFFVPAFIEYNNAATVEVGNTVEPVDSVRVHVFDGSYMRAASSILVGLVLNLALVTAVDQAVHYRYWRAMRSHSLGRQAIFNSSSIVCDYLDDIVPEGDGAVLICNARRLSTLQWFFTSHLTCFGLPEKGLRASKDKADAKLTLRTAKSAKVASWTVPPAATPEIDLACCVVQDGDGNVHLLDGALLDVTSLVFNIKILKNTSVVIK